jgi:DNA invertase Pin-like site-specific DNA recombinase
MTPGQRYEITRPVGYGRQSQARHEDSESLDAQRARCEGWAASRGLQLVGWQEDQNVSGSVAPGDRPGFRRVLDMVKSGRADAIVVADLERFSRSDVGATLELVRALQDEHGCAMVIVDLGGQAVDPSSPTGEFVFTTLLSLARMNLRIMSDKIEDGKTRAARAGKCLGRPELGFDLDDRGYRVPNAEADLVREIFRRVIDDGLHATTRWLAAGNGGLDEHGRPRAWNTSWVKRLISRKVYTGVSEWNGLTVERIPDGYERAGQAPHEAIVDLSTWTRANNRLDAVEPTRALPSAKHHYALTKFVVCDECGKPMRGTLSGVSKKRPRGLPAYRGYCDHGVYARADDLEAATLDVLLEMAAEHGDESRTVPASGQDVAAALAALESAKLARAADAENLELPADILAKRDAAHAVKIDRLEADYASALQASEPVREPSSYEEIQQGGVAGLPDVLRRMYNPAGAVVRVRPGKAPARERIMVDERVALEAGS